MTDAPLREVHRAVYRPVREGNALEDTVARLVQTIRLGRGGARGVAARRSASSQPCTASAATPCARRSASSPTPDTSCGAAGATAARSSPTRCRGRPSRSPCDAAELEDVLGLRRVIEAGAARAAAGRTLDQEARAELWSRYEAASAAGESDYRRADTLLHLTIAELAGIPSLVALAAENRARVNAWLDTFPLLPRNIEHSNVQHERIVTAILAGRADAAEAAILEHLAGSEALLRGFLA